MRSIHRYWFVAMLLGGSGVVWCAENHAPAGGLQSGPQQMVYIAVPIVSAPRDLRGIERSPCRSRCEFMAGCVAGAIAGCVALPAVLELILQPPHQP
jgi:hypothetical protein